MISACAGSGRPVTGPANTSIGAPLMAPAKSYSESAGRQIFEAGDEQRRVLAVDHRDRAGLALVPVFLGDDGAVPALDDRTGS